MKNDTSPTLTTGIERLITHRIYLPFAGLMLFLLVAGVFITLFQVQERQRAQAALLVPQVEIYLDSAYQALDGLENTLTMLDARGQQALLETTLYTSPSFHALYYLDAAGSLIHAAPSESSLPPTVEKQLFASPEGDSVVSLHTRQAAVYISRRLGNGGLLVGQLNLQTLRRYLDTELFASTSQDIVFISDATGTLLTYSGDISAATTGILNSLPAENAHSLRLYQLGKQWYFGISSPIPDIGWQISVRTPFIVVLRTHLVLLALALLVFILSGVFVSNGVKHDIARRIITPIRLLSQQARAVSQNQAMLMARELTVPQTFQELQMLVHSFSDMAQAIQSRQQALEERTQQYRLLVEMSPDAIFLLDRQGEILFCNPQAGHLYGVAEDRLIGRNITELVPADARERLQHETRNLLQHGRVNNVLLTLCRADGERFPVEANAALLTQNNNRNAETIILVVRDTSQRERNAAFTAFLNELTTLALQENNLRDILQNSADLLSEYFNANACYITLWDDQRALTIPTVASGDLRGLYPTLAARPGEGTLTHAVISQERVLAIEDIHHSPHISPQIAVTILETSFLVLPLISGAHKIGAALVGFQQQRTFSHQDIHRGEQIARQISLSLAKTHLLQEERRRRQEAEKLRQITSTLTSTLDLPVVLEHILDALADVLSYDRSTIFLQEADMLKVVALRGDEKHEALQGLVVPVEDDVLTTIIASTRKPLILPDASLDANYMGWGDTADTRGWMGIPLIAHDEIIGYLTIDSLQPNAYGPEHERLAQAFANQAAIAIENARLYAQKQEALEHTSNLYRMARRLISTTNLVELLQIVANDVQMAFFAQVCSILLFDLNTLHIQNHVHSGFGFQIHPPRPELLLSGLHGEAIRNNMAQLAVISSPSEETPLLHQMYSTNAIHSVMAAPLATQHGIIGSIIVHNAPGQAAYTPSDLDLLTTIAHQAATAIQNLTLVADLQQSNRDLTLAYDATIEGWSRALELRDKETQGHTLRVTSLTVKLAQVMGIQGEALTHIRRGALLHDIGKMGIPDRILLKPGSLTAEEWEIMQRHPTYAYEMLSPIAYLRPALHIPYCHHERWDGSGYPRGLRGTEIPLEARIFAVVDVWDALTSDRPYRDAAWDIESTLQYLRQHAGTLFDPMVVRAFEHMMHTEDVYALMRPFVQEDGGS